ncbi:hypothetical protein ACQKJ1_05155 [Methylorubrum rhodesianum]|uniref:hypothetical protein n=1 Tax=Methylorubrum rhodesianum TaxID=29427 RepID=UPI003D027A81
MSTTTHQGAVGAETRTAIAWLEKRLKAARSDSEAHPEGHSNRTFYEAQAIAYENVLSFLEDGKAATPAPRTDGGMTAGEVRTILARLWCQAEGNDPDDTISDAGHTVLDGTLGGLDKKAFVAITEAERAVLKTTTPSGGPRYQYREIGEGEGWRDCSHESYLAFASDPHIDTREVEATPAQPAGAVPESLRALSEGRVECVTRALLDQRGFRYADDPIEFGQDAYDITNETRGEAIAVLNALGEQRINPAHPAGQSAGSGAEIVGQDWKLDDETKAYLRALDTATVHPGDPRLNTMVGPAGPAVGLDGYGSQARPLSPAPDSTRTGQGEAVCDTCGLSIQECNARASASAEAFAEMRRDPTWLPTIKDRPKALWEVAFEKGYLAARPAAPEALIDELTKAIHLSLHPGGNFEMARDSQSPGWMAADALAEQIASDFIAPLLAAHQQVTAERDRWGDWIADSIEILNEACLVSDSDEGPGATEPGIVLAVKRAVSELATATSELARLRAEVEAVLDEATRMSSILLMAGEMTAQERRTARAVALGISLKVRTALARAATAREG